MKMRTARRLDLGLTRAEYAILSRLSTPHKIQNFVNGLRINFERNGDTCLSVRQVLTRRHAHCLEGAMLAACALWIHGEPPLLLDLKAARDFDHVVALFRRGDYWGAISKSNHAQLRYRNPVYRTLRELSMSYFHEYANKRGELTLRSYSRAFNLRTIDPRVWVTNGSNCWDIPKLLDGIRHYPLVTGKQVRLLYRRDAMERKAGALLEYRPRRRS
jgi:hypothetical protein